MSDEFRDELKQFLKYYRVLFIITVVIFAVFAIVMMGKGPRAYYDSPNTERVYGDRRVFDFGDQLTDEEETSLEAYIHEAEKKALCDIVIVTLNESLKDYAPEYKAKYSMTITPDKYVMVYADKFWEDNKFGYDCPQVLDGTQNTGDGVLLVDNVYREEETGKIYTWMCTTGICETTYSSSMVDYALDRFYDYVEYDYYKACIKFVDCVVSDMAPNSYSGAVWPFIAAGIVVLICYKVNATPKAGKKTVTAKTYLVAEPEFSVIHDVFVNKTVTKHYNPPQSSSSGGGGGGHHSSGGGGSHGGGGHSR